MYSKIGLIFLLLLADQMIKTLVVAGNGRYIINTGVAWGWWPSGNWVVMTAVVLISLLIWLRLAWPGVLILSGGLSNLIDRWRWGGVIDYFHWRRLPSFNLADVMIVAGVSLWLLKKWLWSRK
jgi:signal peptidase II